MTFWEYEPGDQAGERRKSAFEELANAMPNPIEAAGQQARELQEFLQAADGSNPFANFNTGDGTSGAAPPLPAPVSPPAPPELPGDPYRVQAPAGNRVAALPTPPAPPAPAAPVDDARQAPPGTPYTLPDYTPGFLEEARRQHEAAEAAAPQIAADNARKDDQRDLDTGFQVGSSRTTRALGGDTSYTPPAEEAPPPPSLLTTAPLEQAVDAQGGRIDFRPDTNDAYARGAQDLSSYVQQASGRTTNHPQAVGPQIDPAIADAGNTGPYLAAEGAATQLIGAPAQAFNALMKAIVGEDVYGREQDALDRIMAVPEGVSAIMSVLAPIKSPVMALRFYGPGAVTNYLVGQGVKPEYANLAGVLVDVADPGEALDVARLGGQVARTSRAAQAAEAVGGVALGGAAGIRAAQQGKSPVDVASAALDAFDSGRMVGGAVDNPQIRAAGRAVQAAPAAVSDFYRGGNQVSESGATQGRTVNTNEAIIRQTARDAGADDLADVLVATAMKEVGESLNPNIPGDGGRSHGVFQEYDNGRGAGVSVESRRDVAAATQRAITEFRQVQARNPNADPGTLAVLAQRPREDLRPGYAAFVNQKVADFQKNPVSAQGGNAPSAEIQQIAERQLQAAQERRDAYESVSAPVEDAGQRVQNLAAALDQIETELGAIGSQFGPLGGTEQSGRSEAQLTELHDALVQQMGEALVDYTKTEEGTQMRVDSLLKDEPSAVMQATAADYRTSQGMDREPALPRRVTVDPRAPEIAAWFNDAQVAPETLEGGVVTAADIESPDPARRSYAHFAQETLGQYKALQDAGVIFTPYHDEGPAGDGTEFHNYSNSAAARADLRGEVEHPEIPGWKRGAPHLYVYADHLTHPLLGQLPGTQGPEGNLNYIFRGVHDAFGHGQHKNQFGPQGEEAAHWDHFLMFSPEAQPAMFAETKGQNSWVNFYGDHASRPITERPYADQKPVMPPAEFMSRGDLRFGKERGVSRVRRPVSTGQPAAPATQVAPASTAQAVAPQASTTSAVQDYSEDYRGSTTDAVADGRLGSLPAADITGARGVSTDVLGQPSDRNIYESAAAEPDRPDRAYQTTGYRDNTPRGDVEGAFRQAEAEGRLPAPQDLAPLTGAPGSSNSKAYKGVPTPVEQILQWAENGSDGRDWYAEYAEFLYDIVQKSPLPSDQKQVMLDEAVVLLGRTGQRTRPVLNVRLAIGLMRARQVLQDRGELKPILDQYMAGTEALDALRERANKTKDKDAKKAIQDQYAGPEAERAAARERFFQTYNGELKGPSFIYLGELVNDALEFWSTGRIEIGSNMKLANYTGAFRDSLRNVYDPHSVPDAWMFYAFGFEDPVNNGAASQPKASEYVMAQISELSARLGVTPIQLQAMIWTGLRKATAGGEWVPPEISNLPEGAEKNKLLTDFRKSASSQGDLADVIKAPTVKPDLDRFEAMVKAGEIKPFKFAGEPQVTFSGPTFEANIARREGAREAITAQSRQVRVSSPAQSSDDLVAEFGVDTSSLTPEQIQGYHRRWVTRQMGLKDGQISVLRDLQIPHQAVVERVGTYEGQPQFNMVVTLDGADEAQGRRIAALLGKVNLQTSVGIYRPVFSDQVESNTLVLSNPNGIAWTPEEVAKHFGETDPGNYEIAADPRIIYWPPFSNDAEALVARLEEAGFRGFQSAKGEYSLVEHGQYNEEIEALGASLAPARRRLLQRGIEDRLTAGTDLLAALGGKLPESWRERIESFGRPVGGVAGAAGGSAAQDIRDAGINDTISTRGFFHPDTHVDHTRTADWVEEVAEGVDATPANPRGYRLPDGTVLVRPATNRQTDTDIVRPETLQGITASGYIGELSGTLSRLQQGFAQAASGHPMLRIADPNAQHMGAEAQPFLFPSMFVYGINAIKQGLYNSTQSAGEVRMEPRVTGQPRTPGGRQVIGLNPWMVATMARHLEGAGIVMDAPSKAAEQMAETMLHEVIHGSGLVHDQGLSNAKFNALLGAANRVLRPQVDEAVAELTPVFQRLFEDEEFTRDTDALRSDFTDFANAQASGRHFQRVLQPGQRFTDAATFLLPGVARGDRRLDPGERGGLGRDAVSGPGSGVPDLPAEGFWGRGRPADVGRGEAGPARSREGGESLADRGRRLLDSFPADTTDEDALATRDNLELALNSPGNEDNLRSAILDASEYAGGLSASVLDSFTDEGREKYAKPYLEGLFTTTTLRAIESGRATPAEQARYDQALQALEARVKAGNVDYDFLKDTAAFKSATAAGAKAQAVTSGGKVAGEWAQRLRYASILSGPAGAIGDLVSNGLNIPRIYVRTGLAAAFEQMKGVPQDQRSATYNELAGLWKGQTSSVGAAFRDAVDVMLHGREPVASEQARTLVGREVLGSEKLATGLGLAVEGGSRLRIASDALFQHVGEQGAVHMLAYRQAAREGLTGSRAQTRITGLITDITTELQKTGSDAVKQGGTALPDTKTGKVEVADLAAEARAIAKRSIFQQELGRNATKAGGVRGDTAVGWVVPFYKTLANIAAEGVTGTVGALGVGIDLGRENSAYGTKANQGRGDRFARTDNPAVLPASQRLADQAMGVLAAGAGFAFTVSGLMTGPGPGDERERKAWLDSGKRPYAWVVRHPDGHESYIPLTRILGPMALPMVVGSAAAEWSKGDPNRQPDEALWKQVALATRDEWFKTSGLEAFDQLLNASGGEGRFSTRNLTRAGASLAGGFIPGAGLLRSIEAATDPAVRDPKTLVEMIKSGLPYFAGDVAPKRNDQGEVTQRSPGSSGARAVLPFQSTEGQPGVRKYQGSASAHQDVLIDRAISRAEAAQKAHRRPSDTDLAIIRKYPPNGAWSRARRDERERKDAG